jgi:hypothetical protein
MNIKILRKNLIKNIDASYVVTRNGRRVEDVNYATQNDAEFRAAKLHAMVKKWDPNTKNSVEIVYTSLPNKVY